MPLQAQTLVHNVRGYALDNGERVAFGAMAFHRGVVTTYFEVPEADIWNNRVLSTWVAGEKMYDASD